jgi:hypothetical protein
LNEEVLPKADISFILPIEVEGDLSLLGRFPPNLHIEAELINRVAVFTEGGNRVGMLAQRNDIFLILRIPALETSGYLHRRLSG